jgi:hypothetical protein
LTEQRVDDGENGCFLFRSDLIESLRIDLLHGRPQQGAHLSRASALPAQAQLRSHCSERIH